MKTLTQLRSELEAAVGAMKKYPEGIVDDDGNTRDMTKDELDEYQKLIDKVESLTNQVKAREQADRLSAAAALPIDGDDETETKDGSVPAKPRTDPDKFKSLGEQLQAIASAGMNDGNKSARDSRLVFKAPTGANEATPSEGGFLVQSDFSTEILDLMHEMGEIVSRVRKLPIGQNFNGVKLPSIDESSRANGSRWGGIQAYWANEADTVTSTKPKLREIELKLEKLMGLGYATEEMLQDAAVLEAIFRTAFTEELVFKTEDAVINGTGSGQPLGIVNSGAVITISGESGQTADTVVYQNILNMMARLPARSMRRAVWLVNQDTLPQLWALTLGSGGPLLFQPPGMNGNVIGNAPFGTLLGRPVIPMEYAATLGDAGDIMLVDLNEYLMIDKGGADWNESMHVRFIYDEMTFKITYRVDGQPAWRTAVTPKNGTNTQSPFIVLDAR